MKKILIQFLDIIFYPFTLAAAVWIKYLSRAGIHRTLLAERTFMAMGVLPVRDHYYQPLINPKKHLRFSLRKNRNLPGINFNDKLQLQILGQFEFNDELKNIQNEPPNLKLSFSFENPNFGPGDAEYLYNMIRKFKPARIIEIGSGYSTIMAAKAIDQNKTEVTNYECKHICIEPFEIPWLEKTGAEVVRKKIELINPNFFNELGQNDILFIDSSHIIRPQGDVLFEYLQILPALKSGVIVHIHDIFTPKDYLDGWILKEHRLWNEQYLLEAFLTQNTEFEIIGALNYLYHQHNEAIKEKCPILAEQKNGEPGSFWIRKK